MRRRIEELEARISPAMKAKPADYPNLVLSATSNFQVDLGCRHVVRETINVDGVVAG
jgi:hypothetical protein